MAESRRSYVRVSYDGKDITEALTTSIIDFSYTDRASGESDEITLKCHDRENKWINDWYPKKVERTIERKNNYDEMAQALQKGVSTKELQRMIDASDLTPEQGQALQTMTESSRWSQVVKENPQYKGVDGKLKLIEDIKGTHSKETVVNNNAIAGTVLRAIICVENWDFEGDNRELDCGSFEIDSVDFSGPPDTVNIKAISVPISSSLRRSKKSRAWENITLKLIAQDIADGAGLELLYEVDGDILYERVEQDEQSDMELLLKECVQVGVALKVTDNKIILFEEAAYESKPVIETFDKSDYGGRLLSYSFSQDTNGTVCKVLSRYKDIKSGFLIAVDYIPPNPPITGQIEYLNQRPGDLRGDDFREPKEKAPPNVLPSMLGPDGSLLPEYQDLGINKKFKAYNDTRDDFDRRRSDVYDRAMLEAKAVARERNKNEWTCTLRLRGNLNMVGGVNIEITGFGEYNGKYSVFDAQHNISGKFETVIKARKVLEGY